MAEPTGSTATEHPRRRRRLLLAVLLGAPLAFVALLVVQALLAARAERSPDPDYRIDARAEPSQGAGSGEPLRIAMLGDSTVAGLGAPSVEGSLAFQVASRVADRTGRPVRVMGYGVSGARTADVVPDQLGEVRGFDPDVVVVVVGANDVTRLMPTWRLRAEVTALAAAIEETGAPAVLGGIPLFGEADLLGQPLRAVVDAYAGVLRPAQREAARSAGMTYVEIARDASPRFEGVPNAMSEDGFHPAPVGYGFWADAIAPAVVEAVEG